MTLDELLMRYRHDSRINALAGQLKEGGHSLRLTGLVGSAPAFVSAAASKHLSDHHLFMLPDKEAAAYFQNDLQQLLPGKTVHFFADSFRRPGHFETIDHANVQMRTEVLEALYQKHRKAGELIATYPEALFETILNRSDYHKHRFEISGADTLDMDFLNELLMEYGFERTDFVYEPGQFAIRGGIVDVFAYAHEYPFRIELFGEEVDSIRLFDPEDQRTLRTLDRCVIIPDTQHHFLQSSRQSLLELLPEKTVLWIKDVAAIADVLQECADHARAIRQQTEAVAEDDAEPSPVPEHAFADPEALRSAVEKFRCIYWGHPDKTAEQARTLHFDMQPQPPFEKDLQRFIRRLQQNEAAGVTNYLFSESSRQIERFYDIFEDRGFDGQFYPIKKTIHEGFFDSGLKVACYTDHQIFNRYHKYRLRRSFSRSKAVALKALKQLKSGDYVTHVDHGIGEYMGLQKIEVNGTMQEAVRIRYKDDDLLFVNIHSLHKISRFVGKDGTPPKLHKLGSDAWDKLKRKTKRKVKDIAADLIKLYAERKSSKGYTFPPDNYLQAALEASFIYVETPDQGKAVEEVKQDMEAEYPMDRLICGDVGFGKTEVAVRAAFKTVSESKQVAVLVPTTILAFQHYKTFSERLSDFPCKVAYVNRFKTAAEQKQILKKLVSGEIDILIGTHRLLGKDVRFHDLGLLVVDEEQKFGVAHKEKLRQLSIHVDTITLTATPIPRTLQFSLMGARDLSVINTPPPNRQAIETELRVFDRDIIKDAVDYEVARGGQVFFVHNRIKDIEGLANLLRELCPDVRVGVAHGQMEGRTLETVMLKFIEGKYDVLLSTAIVESGIDIANVNTMIINNAHHFGLSDLHQLRGRVGRSNKKAFCYLFAPPAHTLPNDARRRLQTITEFSELGSGFSIALRDMDIRGAGNLLGAEQSGFVAEIGLEAYHKILDEALQELKETTFKDLFKEELQKRRQFVQDCQIETDIEIYLPDDYVNNINERLSLYTRLNNAKTEDALQRHQEELADRFGPVPDRVKALFDAIRLRWLAKALGFERVFLKHGRLKCFFVENRESAYYESEVFRQVLAYVQEHATRCTLKETRRHLILTFREVEALHEAITLLQAMTGQVEAVGKV